MQVTFAKNATEYATQTELAQLENSIQGFNFQSMNGFCGKLDNAPRNARVTLRRVSANTSVAEFEFQHAKHGNWVRVYATLSYCN